MSTLLDIINRAVIKVGESPVTLDEFDEASTKVAKAMAQIYPMAKSHILRNYPWKAATKYSKLTPYTRTAAQILSTYGTDLTGLTFAEAANARFYVETDPVFYVALDYRFSRSFALPSDLLRTQLLTDQYCGISPYSISGQYAHADDSSIYIRYTADIPETELDDSLADVLAAYLAKECIFFLGDKEQKPALDAEFYAAWRIAKSLDAQQDASRLFVSADWLTESRGGFPSDNGTPYSQLT